MYSHLHWSVFASRRCLHELFVYDSFLHNLILLLLLISGIHPNPGPTQSSSSPLPTILQFNCNGLKNSVAEINDFLISKRISVAALQETFLSTTSVTPSFLDFALIRKVRPLSRGSGLAFLIHHSVYYSHVDTSYIQDSHTECQAVRVKLNGSDLFNVYLPPVSSCPQDYQPNLSSILYHSDDDILICGDLNAHHEAWDSSLTDPRGDSILASVEISPLISLNDPDTPTRLPKSSTAASPDVTLASAHVALVSTWATHVQLNSDHLPITVSLPCDEVPPPRTTKSFTNFCKADWPAFIRESEGIFRGLETPLSCGAGEKLFRNVLQTAAKHSIPAGYRRECTPGISREAAAFIMERDNLRAADLADPAIELLNHDISYIIAENKRNLWRDKVKEAESHPDPSKCWSLLRGLSGKKTFVPPNQPISFGNAFFSNSAKNSEQFIRQFVPAPKSDPLTRLV
jgi:hypothetical protein